MSAGPNWLLIMPRWTILALTLHSLSLAGDEYTGGEFHRGR